MSQSPKKDMNRSATEETVRACDVHFSYAQQDESGIEALNGVSLSIRQGMHAVLIGRNGSGKSTFAKLVNVLEIPDKGTVSVFGLDTSREENFWTIRSRCGMVFQNPDNQIVGTSVEEDVAFGPENLGIPTPEIRKRVDDALEYVGLIDLADKIPSNLSGGQKQKLAIAGVLAMSPEVLLLDESTAMLDPVSRNEFLALVERLRNDKGITVIHITHDMSEVYLAERVFVLDKGRIILEGEPKDIFFNSGQIERLGLDIPVFAAIVSHLCAKTGSERKIEYFSSRTAALDAARHMMREIRNRRIEVVEQPKKSVLLGAHRAENSVLRVKDLSYTYTRDSQSVLENISFSVQEGEIFSIIGHSGSGKTTLISHLNGLIRPQKGSIHLMDSDRAVAWDTRKNADVKEIRKRVGLLFQYPEYQLFEETVRKDILYGPLKMGLSRQAAEENMMDALALVGLDSSILSRSPFELSGGQKRRVAFAGIIAMNPQILVLDEPAAGLDPEGRREIFRYILELKKRGKTIILVSHNMDEAARISDRLLVLAQGKMVFLKTPQELFSDRKDLCEIGLDLPEATLFMNELALEFEEIKACVFDPEEVADELINAAIAARSKDSAQRKGKAEGKLEVADKDGTDSPREGRAFSTEDGHD